MFSGHLLLPGTSLEILHDLTFLTTWRSKQPLFTDGETEFQVDEGLKRLSSSSSNSGVTQFYLLIPRCLIISPVHLLCDVLFGSIQLLSHVQLFETPWTAAC